MTIVLTNDDGVDAPGLAALLAAVTASPDFADERIVTIAPQEQQSGCGHQVTTHQPIQVQRRQDNVYAIAGTPADCVRLAISHLCPDVRLVFAGINAGGNLGADIYISGTVAAVREAALHGLPAMALSHYRQGGRAIDWSLASTLAQQAMAELLPHPLPQGGFWNVNLPHLSANADMPPVVICPLCRQPLPNSYRQEGSAFHYNGIYSQRSRDPGADVALCMAGHIAATQLHL